MKITLWIVDTCEATDEVPLTLSPYIYKTRKGAEEQLKHFHACLVGSGEYEYDECGELVAPKPFTEDEMKKFDLEEGCLILENDDENTFFFGEIHEKTIDLNDFLDESQLASLQTKPNENNVQRNETSHLDSSLSSLQADLDRQMREMQERMNNMFNK